MLGSLGDRIRMSDATSASGHNGDGRTSGWLDLVANGPKRTGRSERPHHGRHRKVLCYFRSRCHEPSQPSLDGAAINLSMRLMNVMDGPSSGITRSAASKA